ncbi:MAG: hypothetical protein RQ982_05475, partial [Gammaproteobacteria bacterium]|nr:hypothetical protein [Gammaproteobacteria bacterium]
MTTETQPSETEEESSGLELLKQVVADLDAGNQETLTATLEEVHPSEVANLIESLPQEKRSELWE